jgi:hypothetical protein
LFSSDFPATDAAAVAGRHLSHLTPTAPTPDRTTPDTCPDRLCAAIEDLG